jgi:cation diffusion facilitator CzcD-associated flavoprotein CzcO
LKVASKHNLSELTLFNTRVTLIEWDDSMSSYKLKYTRELVIGEDNKSKKDVKQETFEKHFNYVFGAIGPLHVPKTPNFKGLGEFKGRIIHTAAWDSSYDFNGKKVIVIGTGASAVQAIPHLQKQGSTCLLEKACIV